MRKPSPLFQPSVSQTYLLMKSLLLRSTLILKSLEINILSNGLRTFINSIKTSLTRSQRVGRGSHRFIAQDYMDHFLPINCAQGPRWLDLESRQPMLAAHSLSFCPKPSPDVCSWAYPMFERKTRRKVSRALGRWWRVQ